MGDDPPATLPGSVGEPVPAAPPHDRYRVLSVIGAGGTGAVLRALDERLQVEVAVKVLHAHHLDSPEEVRRFVAEARLLASLEGSGVPAVHDLGAFGNGQPFYTMEVVEGAPLHRAFSGASVRQRLIWVLRCASIAAHAHDLGVVHLDLSSANVVVSNRGEVRVVDWGLALRVGEERQPTRGTPGYASAEQLAGAPPHPSMDVFALGGLLILALTDRAPDAEVEQGSIHDPDLVALVAGCRGAPTARYGHARWVEQGLQRWLDGALRRERAEAQLRDAEADWQAARAARARAAALQQRAAAALDPVEPHQAEQHKWPGWDLEEWSRDELGRADQLESEYEQRLLQAVRIDPDYDPPHDALANLWLDQLESAEQRGDARTSRRREAFLQTWREGRYRHLADAPSVVRLTSDPVGATVTVERFVERRRRLVPFTTAVATTPCEVILVPGSYRLRVVARGHHEVLLPLRTRRGQTWSPRGPGGEASALWLPPVGTLGPEDCYVPGGWFVRGGDPAAADGLPRQEVFVGAFVMRKHPVTVAEYRGYLESLARSGGLEEALQRVPRYAGQPVFEWRDGAFTVGGDVGAPWEDREPVRLITWDDAVAFAAHAGWRLPTDTEWEKAARGGDERIFSWGYRFDPTWANTALSHPEHPRAVVVDAFPGDESPYGVRGMTGNVRDWCENTYDRAGRAEAAGTLRALRGGSWSSAEWICRLATRFAAAPETRFNALGFRLTRSLSPPSRSAAR